MIFIFLVEVDGDDGITLEHFQQFILCHDKEVMTVTIYVNSSCLCKK